MLNNQHTKYIGIDFGKKRTGISISDYDKVVSFPLETIDTNNLIDFLKELSRKENIEKIIIGKPLKLNNTVHNLEKDIIDFMKTLNESLPEITVERIDERYTSKISKKIIDQLNSKKKIRMDKSIIDKISASLILESYLIKMSK